MGLQPRLGRAELVCLWRLPPPLVVLVLVLSVVMGMQVPQLQAPLLLTLLPVAVRALQVLVPQLQLSVPLLPLLLAVLLVRVLLLLALALKLSVPLLPLLLVVARSPPARPPSLGGRQAVHWRLQQAEPVLGRQAELLTEAEAFLLLCAASCTHQQTARR